MRTMATLTGNLDRDPVSGGHHGTGIQTNGARPHGWPVVHAVDRLHRKTLKQPVLNHGPGASIALLTRLKNQHSRAVKVSGLGQVTRGAHQHRRVTVMATAVHQTGRGRLPGKVVVLSQRQSVHVGPQANHLAALGGAPALDERHQTGLADACVNFIHAAHFQCLMHPFGCIELLKPQFGVRMQVTPKGGDFGVKRRNMRKCTSVDAVGLAEG